MRTRTFFRALALGWLPMIFILGDLCNAQTAWTFPDFSATEVFPSNKADLEVKVSISGSNVRVDRSAAIATLYAPSIKKVYSLTTYPDQSHQCVAMKPEQARMMPSPLGLIQGQIVKRSDAGTEVVEGHPTKIQEVSVVGADGKTIDSKVWEAEDLKGVPVKIESHIEGRTLIAVYRDIAIGAPDQGLFRVPDRCTPFEKMWQVARVRPAK